MKLSEKKSMVIVRDYSPDVTAAQKMRRWIWAVVLFALALCMSMRHDLWWAAMGGGWLAWTCVVLDAVATVVLAYWLGGLQREKQ